jgi:D-alanyl-D-alanine dipeptidase
MENNLSKNFTLRELCATSTGITNIPGTAEIESLKLLVEKVLQPARDLYCYPITVNSGFRSKLVNRKISGSPTSQHVKGQAADITCRNNNALFHLMKNNLDFDQLIWEFGNNEQPKWIHVSYKPSNNRKQILKAISSGGRTKYLPYEQ